MVGEGVLGVQRRLDGDDLVKGLEVNRRYVPNHVGIIAAMPSFAQDRGPQPAAARDIVWLVVVG